VPDAPDSTNKIVPPFSPFRAQIEPPDKKRKRGRAPKKQQRKEGEKDGEKGDRGKAVDVLI
jgi:hypothetical protein